MTHESHMTHTWDVPRVDLAVVHLLNECLLDLVLLAEAVHNVRELNEFTAAIRRCRCPLLLPSIHTH